MSSETHVYLASQSDSLCKSTDVRSIESCRASLYVEMVDKLPKGSSICILNCLDGLLWFFKLYHEEDRATNDDALPIAEFSEKQILLYEDCYSYLDMLLGMWLQAFKVEH